MKKRTIREADIKRRVKYVNPDPDERDAVGSVVGVNHFEYNKAEGDRRVRSAVVAVLWDDGMLTLEDIGDVTSVGVV